MEIGVELAFKKSDIKDLDHLLKALIDIESSENRGLCVADEAIKTLPYIKDCKSNDCDLLEKEFMFYIHAFTAHNVGRIQPTDTYTYLRANENTRLLYEQGGFASIYNKYLKNETDKENQSTLTKKQIQDININRYISIAALLISLISLVYSCFKK